MTRLLSKPNKTWFNIDKVGLHKQLEHFYSSPHTNSITSLRIDKLWVELFSILILFSYIWQIMFKYIFLFGGEDIVNWYLLLSKEDWIFLNSEKCLLLCFLARYVDIKHVRKHISIYTAKQLMKAIFYNVRSANLKLSRKVAF